MIDLMYFKYQIDKHARIFIGNANLKHIFFIYFSTLF